MRICAKSALWLSLAVSIAGAGCVPNTLVERAPFICPADGNCGGLPLFCDGTFCQVACGYGHEPCTELGNVFECGSGALVPTHWQCDSEFDCSDGSDELDCLSSGVDNDGCVQIPGGEVFTPATPDEGFPIGVADFCMDVTEVTVADYLTCVQAGQCSVPGTGDSTIGSNVQCNWEFADRFYHPINCVDWYQATAYCASVGKRLPTSNEWQWAAQGQDAARSYPWGEQEPDCYLAVMRGPMSPNYNYTEGCGKNRTSSVGSKSPGGDSRGGLKDMAGNVAEWSLDGYVDILGDERRYVKGSNWRDSFVDLTYDGPKDPLESDDGVGFRCVSSAVDGDVSTCKVPCSSQADCMFDGLDCLDILSEGFICVPTQCTQCFAQGLSCSSANDTCQFYECV